MNSSPIDLAISNFHQYLQMLAPMLLINVLLLNYQLGIFYCVIFFPFMVKFHQDTFQHLVELFKGYKDLSLPKRIERNFGFLLNKLVVE